MIKLENTVVPSNEQWNAVVLSMRNPLNSWHKSDSGFCKDTLSCDLCIVDRSACKRCIDEHAFIIGSNDVGLMKRLCKAGTDHRKFMRMLPIIVDITAPMYWIAEHDTYKVSTVRNSCSFMHKGTAKEFSITDFSVEDERLYKCLIEDNSNNLYKEYCSYKNNEEIKNEDHLELFCLAETWEHVLKSLNSLREVYLETKDESVFRKIRQLLPTGYEAPNIK